MSLLARGDRPARTPARRGDRRRAGGSGPRSRLAQGAQAPGWRAGVPPAGSDDERDRGMIGGYKVTLREGPRVSHSRHPDLDDALGVIEREATTLASRRAQP